MNRIDATFTRLKKEKRLALMPFLVAGFPDFSRSLKYCKLLARNADLLEIGFPYSDPLADGQVIQKADQVALASGITVDKVFKLIRQLRQATQIPITVLVYVNLVYQRGIEKFYRDAAKVGIDGVLIPDLPFEESDLFVKTAKKFQIDHICLIAPTTDSARVRKIFTVAQGYLYLTSVLGVTGARTDIPQPTLIYLRQLSRKSRLPIAVGFGISNSSQVKKLKNNGAAGVIVGSHLIRMIADGHAKSLPGFLHDLMKR